MAADFGVLITTPNNSFFIDSVSTFTVNGQNEMTSHPMISGDIVGDHIIVKPCTINVSGSFGMNASTKYNLANIEKTFEDIKDKAISCTVAKCKANGKEFRFIKRRNMILTGINWDEGINSLGFTFTFSQILVDNVIERSATTTNNLPNTYSLETLSISDSIIDTNELIKQIINIMVDKKIVTYQFLDTVSAMTPLGGWVPIIANLASGKEVTAEDIKRAGVKSILATTGAGLIYYLYKLIADSSTYISAFKVYSTNSAEEYEKQRQENKRFAELMDDILSNVSYMNDFYKTYKFNADGEQEVTLLIGNDYYTLRLTQNNLNKRYQVQLLDFNDNIIKTAPLTKYTDFSKLSKNNAFVKITTRDNTYTVHFLGADNDLRNSEIVVSSVDPTKFSEQLGRIIVESLTV